MIELTLDQDVIREASKRVTELLDEFVRQDPERLFAIFGVMSSYGQQVCTLNRFLAQFFEPEAPLRAERERLAPLLKELIEFSGPTELAEFRYQQAHQHAACWHAFAGELVSLCSGLDGVHPGADRYFGPRVRARLYPKDPAQPDEGRSYWVEPLEGFLGGADNPFAEDFWQPEA